MRWALRILAALLLLSASAASAQAPSAKLALVIGVADYERERAAQEAAGFVVPPALANSVRDANLVADALGAQGFDVTRVMNPDKRAMLAAVNNFASALQRAGPDAVGVFYFAGHGAQGRPALERDIDNYLIPVGADLVTEVDLESEALGLSRVSATLRPGPRGAMVLILDACRDFALPASTRTGMRTRGLVEARAAPGTIIAYATSPGAVAVDGAEGENGPYARALAAQVRAARGTRLEDVFIAVRNAVLDATRNTQVPWENGSLRRAVTLGVAPPTSAGAMPRPRLTVDRVEGDWVLCWKDDPNCLVSVAGAMPAGLIKLSLGWDGAAQLSDTFSAPKNGRWRIENEEIVVQLEDWSWRGTLLTGECQVGRATTAGGRVIAGAMSRAASRSATECWASAAP